MTAAYCSLMDNYEVIRFFIKAIQPLEQPDNLGGTALYGRTLGSMLKKRTQVENIELLPKAILQRNPEMNMNAMDYLLL